MEKKKTNFLRIIYEKEAIYTCLFRKEILKEKHKGMVQKITERVKEKQRTLIKIKRKSRR